MKSQFTLNTEMKFFLEKYIKDVKSQLVCNNPNETEYITFYYTEEQIDENLKYFFDFECFEDLFYTELLVLLIV